MSKFLRFTAFGAVGTSIQYAVLIPFVHIVSLNAVIASTIGFTCGAFANYGLNYKYTYRSKKRHREAITKFFSVAFVGLVLNSFVMTIGTHMLKIYYIPVQLSATAIVLIWNFSANTVWTFAEKDDETRKPRR